MLRYLLGKSKAISLAGHEEEDDDDDESPYRCQTGWCSKLVEGLKGECGLSFGIRRLTLVGRHDYGLRCEWDGT